MSGSTYDCVVCRGGVLCALHSVKDYQDQEIELRTELTALRAENAAFRVTLERIAEGNFGTESWQATLQDAIRIASAVLAAHPTEEVYVKDNTGIIWDVETGNAVGYDPQDPEEGEGCATN